MAGWDSKLSLMMLKSLCADGHLRSFEICTDSCWGSYGCQPPASSSFRQTFQQQKSGKLNLVFSDEAFQGALFAGRLSQC